MERHPVRRARSVRIALAEASGRTLAGPLRALENVPPFARSRVDGYAVILTDVAGASREHPARLRVSGDVPMGAPAPGPIKPGTAVRVPTGGAMPDFADGAVMIEDTVESGGYVDVFDAAEADVNLTETGADLKAGDPLFDAGTVLTPAKIGLLAGAGIAEIDAYARPRVALLLTGDELAAPGAPMRSGEIRDINRYSLAAALAAAGFEPVAYDRVPDELAAYEAAFARAIAECDAVVISGGSSAGERDYTPAVVAAAGSPGVVVHHIKMKPGRPTLLGMIGDKPIVGLPGNPVSAFVMLHVVGFPVLLRMLDRRPDAVPIRAVLSQEIAVTPALEHRIPVRLRFAGGEIIAEPLIGTSAQMRILGFADALITVPLGAGRIPAGAVVDATPMVASGVSP
jgi:molybdopterin molybdotransferase